MFTDVLVNIGGSIEIKSVENGVLKFGGWLVPFGDATKTDLDGDFFSSNTDFDIEDGAKTAIYYHHALNRELKTRKLGTGQMYLKDAGVWMEGELKARDAYEENILKMVQAGKLDLSSGTAAHLVQRKSVSDKANEILYWPLGLDASLTPTPANPAANVYPLKAWSELLDNAENPPKSPFEKGDFEVASKSTFSINETDQHEGLRFADHSEQVRAAVGAYKARVLDWIQDRAESRKEGKVLSVGNIELLTVQRDELSAAAKSIDEILAAHAPTPPPDYDSEVLDLEMRFLTQEHQHKFSEVI